MRLVAILENVGHQRIGEGIDVFFQDGVVKSLVFGETVAIGVVEPYVVITHQGNEIEVTLWIPKSEKIKGFNLTMSKPYQKPTEAAQPAQEVPQSISEEPGNSLPF